MGVVLIRAKPVTHRIGIGGLESYILYSLPLVAKNRNFGRVYKSNQEDIMSNQLTNEERKELEELRNYKQRQAQKGSVIKVSQKGAISVYGLGRFPVTLYVSQWKKVLGMAKDIAQFAIDHQKELAIKE